MAKLWKKITAIFGAGALGLGIGHVANKTVMQKPSKPPIVHERVLPKAGPQAKWKGYIVESYVAPEERAKNARALFKDFGRKKPSDAEINKMLSYGSLPFKDRYNNLRRIGFSYEDLARLEAHKNSGEGVMPSIEEHRRLTKVYDEMLRRAEPDRAEQINRYRRDVAVARQALKEMGINPY